MAKFDVNGKIVETRSFHSALWKVFPYRSVWFDSKVPYHSVTYKDTYTDEKITITRLTPIKVPQRGFINGDGI